MKKSRILKLSLAAILALAICVPGFSYKIGGKELVKNGAGSRIKKVVFVTIKVYWVSLFVSPELKGATDKQLIEADAPMVLDFFMTTDKITKDKFVESISEAFDKVAKAGYPADKNAYLKLYANETIGEGDTTSNRYDPKTGLSVVLVKKDKTVKNLGTIKGIAVKKALLGIFLSSDPVQPDLKNKMLGK